MNDQVRAAALLGEIVVFAVKLMAIKAEAEFHGIGFRGVNKTSLSGSMSWHNFQISNGRTNNFLWNSLETFLELRHDSDIQ